MANPSIYDKIIQKGEQDAKMILESGEAQARKIYQSRLKEAETVILSDRAKFKEKQDIRFKGKVTEFEQQAKAATLAQKQQLLTSVFNQAMTKLEDISDEKWVQLVKHLLDNDHLTGTETIIAAKADHVRFKKLFASNPAVRGKIELDKLNASFADSAFKLVLSEQLAPISGGFLVVGSAFDIDHSYPTLLLSFKNQFEAELACYLFESEA
ncbi:MAG: V-type ATP synthase subunit E family protein [Candidatus Izemoplasmatales bacterium]|nr:V-type ATP synthase subunit E family protein [Candidatus Izemoplasmatales bacterium]